MKAVLSRWSAKCRVNPSVALPRAATCMLRASRVIDSCCEYRVLLGVCNDAKGARAACAASSPVVRKTNTCRSTRRALYSWGGRAFSQEIYATFGRVLHAKCDERPCPRIQHGRLSLPGVVTRLAYGTMRKDAAGEQARRRREELARRFSHNIQVTGEASRRQQAGSVQKPVPRSWRRTRTIAA